MLVLNLPRCWVCMTLEQGEGNDEDRLVLFKDDQHGWRGLMFGVAAELARGMKQRRFVEVVETQSRM